MDSQWGQIRSLKMGKSRLKILKLLSWVILIIAPFSPSYADTATKLCEEQTRWHHIGIKHVLNIDIEVTRPVCEQALLEDKNNPDTRFGIARILYYEGRYKKARPILELLLEDGYAHAGELLAQFYFFGDSVEISYEKFFQLAKRAHELGSVGAGNQLHHSYYWGYGVLADDKLAIKYLEEAVERGDSRSIIELSQALTHGDLGYEVDRQRARSLLATELINGNVDAEIQFNVIRLLEPKDLIELIETRENLIRLSDDGYEGAMYALLKMEMSENWFEDVGRRYSYKQNPLIAEKYALQLLDSGYGFERFENLVYEDNLGAAITENQMKQIMERLEEVAQDESIFDTRTAVVANNILSEIHQSGIAGPVNRSLALEYLITAAEKYGDGRSANEASWTIFTSIKDFDLERAIVLAKIAILSDEPHIRATGHNNLGVYFHFSQLDDALKKAKYHYLKAAELYSEQDYIDATPFDNLARIHLFNVQSNSANVKEAKRWATLSDQNEGNGFFTDLIGKYPFTNNTSIDQARSWLEEEALKQNPAAFIELAFLEENFQDHKEIIKWYKLCSMMCETLERERANQELSKKQHFVKGLDFTDGEKLASEWLRESYKFVAAHSVAREPLNPVASDKKIKMKGNLFAFLVGINRYEHFENLSTPIRDIYKIGQVLEQKFNAQTTYLENPTRRDITSEMNTLRKKLTPNDSVIVYYAGHGHFDDDTGEGYWLPKEAAVDDDTDWVSNNYVLNKLKAFRANNVMLVADSCFSGSIITRGVSLPQKEVGETILEKYLNTPSRIAITSGGLKPVLDGGGNGNSIFAESFAKILSSVLTPMTSAELYLQVRDEVTRKSLAAGVDQTPLRGEILAAGHQGPDFVLIPE